MHKKEFHLEKANWLSGSGLCMAAAIFHSSKHEG